MCGVRFGNLGNRSHRTFRIRINRRYAVIEYSSLQKVVKQKEQIECFTTDSPMIVSLKNKVNGITIRTREELVVHDPSPRKTCGLF